MRTIPAAATAALLLAVTAGCEQQQPATSGTTQAAAPSSARALSPGTTIDFRVVAGRNPSGCWRFDGALSRVHTLTTTADGGALLQTAGGVRSTMTQTSPGIYTTRLGMRGRNFDVVANASTTPRTLTVTEPRLGCRWSAVAP